MKAGGKIESENLFKSCPLREMLNSITWSSTDMFWCHSCDTNPLTWGHKSVLKSTSLNGSLNEFILWWLLDPGYTAWKCWDRHFASWVTEEHIWVKPSLHDLLNQCVTELKGLPLKDLLGHMLAWMFGVRCSPAFLTFRKRIKNLNEWWPYK